MLQLRIEKSVAALCGVEGRVALLDGTCGVLGTKTVRTNPGAVPVRSLVLMPWWNQVSGAGWWDRV